MEKELFLEIGTEEIPAGFIPKAMAEMEALIRKELNGAQIGFGAVKTLATPRRLALVVHRVAVEQPTLNVKTFGPARNVAFDAEGKPTKAAEGFARAQGIDVSSLKVEETEKGPYITAEKEVIGRPTAELLVEILPRLINSIQFRKSMRWGDMDVRFARPIHWIVALFDGIVVPFTFGNLDSGSVSRGHRFMADSPFPVRDFHHYMEECERHFVVPDPEQRKDIIRREIERVAKAAGGSVLPDEELLEQVAFLVEYPSAVCGTFSPDFLAVPKEVLITSMRSHQRYFSLVDDKGQLLPAFITINNTLAEDPSVVVKGNERVLRARLSDARFFFDEDKKVPLQNRVESLKSVLYQAKLGTSHEKMERFRAVAEGLAGELRPALKEKVSRAAYLCKADLVTGMVGEFPEVQGVMGREYALLDREEPEVARAIYEHYLPIQAGGDLPGSDCGAIVSIADKIDTICGCFGVGLIPTGAADPYALRRSALGIINIILDREYPLLLGELIDRALLLLRPKLTRPETEIRRDVLEFFRGRFVNLMTGRFPGDVVDAVVSISFDNLVESAAKIAALAEFKTRPDFEQLAVAFKRVSNIIKEVTVGEVVKAHFQEPIESELHEKTEAVGKKTREKLAAGSYLDALTEISNLRETVDRFFKDVMVMTDDEELRNNRLALLGSIARIFSNIADFSRISTC
jgi:glycyl-tRNA synthetase beta chain